MLLDRSSVIAALQIRCDMLAADFDSTMRRFLPPQPKIVWVKQRISVRIAKHSQRFHVASCRKNFRLFSRLPNLCRRLNATWTQHGLLHHRHATCVALHVNPASPSRGDPLALGASLGERLVSRGRRPASGFPVPRTHRDFLRSARARRPNRISRMSVVPTRSPDILNFPLSEVKADASHRLGRFRERLACV